MSNWQEGLDREIVQNLNDPYFLMEMAVVLRAKAESVDLIVKCADVREMILNDPRNKPCNRDNIIG